MAQHDAPSANMFKSFSFAKPNVTPPASVVASQQPGAAAFLQIAQASKGIDPEATLKSSIPPSSANLRTKLRAGASKRKHAAGENSQPRAAAKVAKSQAGPGLAEKLGTQPLRLIIVGHNPSDHAWATGHFYSNPSNRMWPILSKVGIAPPGINGAQDDDKMPACAGVGFTDVGTGHPGTDSSAFKSEVFTAWRDDFYMRLRKHLMTAAQSIGCTCCDGRCAAPALVAFAGKRQFLELLNVDRQGKDKVKSIELGRQAVLPSGWPLPDTTEVYVCCSTSGAAPMTTAQREAPYLALAQRLQQIPWPRQIQLRCMA